jgi:hypothetical protein
MAGQGKHIRNTLRNIRDLPLLLLLLLLLSPASCLQLLG